MKRRIHFLYLGSKPMMVWSVAQFVKWSCSIPSGEIWCWCGRRFKSNCCRGSWEVRLDFGRRPSESRLDFLTASHLDCVANGRLLCRSERWKFGIGGGGGIHDIGRALMLLLIRWFHAFNLWDIRRFDILVLLILETEYHVWAHNLRNSSKEIVGRVTTVTVRYLDYVL